MSTQNKTSQAVEELFKHDAVGVAGKPTCTLFSDRATAIAQKYRRMEEAQRQLESAIVNEGINPSLHRQVIAHVKRYWPTLWKAIETNRQALSFDPLSE